MTMSRKAKRYEKLHALHAHRVNLLYDNGCIACDMIEQLHSLLETDESPVPWLTWDQALLATMRELFQVLGEKE